MQIKAVERGDTIVLVAETHHATIEFMRWFVTADGQVKGEALAVPATYRECFDDGDWEEDDDGDEVFVPYPEHHGGSAVVDIPVCTFVALKGKRYEW